MELNTYLNFDGQCEAAFRALQLKEPAEADRVFRELAEGGTIQLPIEQTFWAVRFGMLVDRFGIPWMINCEQAD
jgi:PhnB protein